MGFLAVSRSGSGFRLLLGASMVALPLAVSGCMSSSADDMDLATLADRTEPPDQLYNQGLANLEAGRMGEASKKFQALDRQHPYSEQARKAMVLDAFASYRNGRYDDAIAASNRYIQLYPTTPDAAYAQYIVGLSYFRQIPDVTRDQKSARRAIEAMEQVGQRWPDSEYVDDANEKIRFARDQLAGKEMQVGRYYLERREYVASIKRFRYVVENYSNTRHIEEALARLTEAYYAMGLTSEAQAAAAVLGQNYPDSQWYKDSYALLQKQGLEPRESGTSWLSAAGRAIMGGRGT